ncbi:MAG: hypothetical protein KKA79_00500 [Nanoarchaeota archaeon]|nr:hypothetical protein [Nanoarchaeota archaeon]MCG2717305.1 hypothetical protein [Nanoarchaeota archaeon]
MDQEKFVKIVIYGGIIVILAFIFTIFFTQKLTPGTYQYVHGMDTFDVQQVGTTEEGGITYKIKIFVGNDASPKYIYTRHEPQEMEGLKIANGIKEILNKKEIYTVINPNEGLTGRTVIAALEIDKFIDNAYLFQIPVKSAFTEKDENNPDYPVMNCESVTEDIGIIWLTLGEETIIKNEEGCIIIQGQTEDDIIKLSDGLIFYLLGMIG